MYVTNIRTAIATSERAIHILRIVFLPESTDMPVIEFPFLKVLSTTLII